MKGILTWNTLILIIIKISNAVLTNVRTPAVLDGRLSLTRKRCRNTENIPVFSAAVCTILLTGRSLLLSSMINAVPF